MLRNICEPCEVLIDQPLFPIKRVYGSTANNFVSNDYQKLIAYSAESVVIVWDWSNDRYTYLSGHNNEIITSICFHPSGEYLITTSLLSICVWNISQQSLVYCCRFKNGTDTNFTNMKSSISKNAEYFFVFTDLSLIIYEIIHFELSLISVYQFNDPIEDIILIESLHHTYNKFVTLTKNEIQLWKFHRDKTMQLSESIDDDENDFLPFTIVIKSLSKKSYQFIEEHENIPLNSLTSLNIDESNHIYLLSQMGPVILLDENMNILSSITCKGIECFFNSICIGKKLMIIGTSKGDIEIWNKRQLKYLKSMSYPQRLRKSIQYQYIDINDTKTNYINNYKKSKTINTFECKKIKLDEDGEKLIISYSDNSIFILNLKCVSLIRYNITHFSNILSVESLNNHKYTDCIITSSLDQTLCIFNHKRLVKIIDVRHMIDNKFSYMSLPLHRTLNKIYVTSIVSGINENNEIIATGNNLGMVRILNIKHNNEIICVSSSNISSSKIKSLSFDKYCQYLCVHRENNEVTLFNTKKYTNQLIPMFCLQRTLTDDNNQFNIVQKSFLLKHKSTWQTEKDLQCWIGTTNSPKNCCIKNFFCKCNVCKLSIKI